MTPVSDIGVIGASSDWHLGGGGKADDCHEAGLYWVHQQFFACPGLTDIVALGDTGEGLQFLIREIFARRGAFLRWLDAECARHGVCFHLVDGNHDPEGWAAALRSVMTTCEFHAAGRVLRLGGWVFVHGCSGPGGEAWDVWNGFNSPLKPVANAATWVAGVLERALWRGFDENRLNPRNWFSPARTERERLHAAIRDRADEHVEATGEPVCYGHTHRRRIASSGRVVNTGCVVGSHAEGVLIWPDGTVNSVQQE